MSSSPSASDGNQQEDKQSTIASTEDNQARKESAPAGSSESSNPTESGDNMNTSAGGNDPFAHPFRKSHSNESSSGSGESNHSSGMLSIGNSSFNFNFDSDPMMHLGGSSSGVPSEKTSEGENSDNSEKQRKSNDSEANAAADANVANLQLLARSQVVSSSIAALQRKRSAPEPSAPSAPRSQNGPPPMPFRSQNQSMQADGGSVASNEHEDYYDDDDDHNSRSTADPRQQSGDSPQPKRRKKRLDERKRVERNAREKERSFRISKQINDLRSLLSSGGVIVPKGTKSSVLTEAANYIRMLQQHQYRSEM